MVLLEKQFAITRADYQRVRATLFANNAANPNGAESAAAYTDWVDEVLKGYFKQFFAVLPLPLAVFALGSYGRVELNPYSDIDILLIYDGESAPVQKGAKAFIQALWDVGLEIGNQFVTPEQCCKLALADSTTRTTVLEMRLICGDTQLAARLEQLMNKEVFTHRLDEFANQLLTDTKLRHQRYGGSPQLLEPHLKDGVGSLRDLHVLLWLFRVNAEWQNHLVIKQDNRPSILNFLDRLRDLSLILLGDAEKLALAFQFLLRVRSQLHLDFQDKHDLLDYSVQKKIAAELGYRDSEQWLAVEHFMRDYYTHTRRIYHAYSFLSEKLARHRPSISSKVKSQEKRLTAALLLENGEIKLDPNFRRQFTERHAELMRVFLLRQQLEVHLSESLRESIYYVTSDLNADFRTDPEAIDFFLQIIANPKHLANTLRTMHNLNLLDVFLPEFSALTSLAQHDLYHYYSTDEHTLIALDNVAKLAGSTEKQSFLAAVFQQLREPKILFLAVLFHDLGKAKKGDHCILGSDIATDILTRWGIEGETISRIAFLVRNHQKMEQMAFRRNFEESSTLQEFVRLVEDEENLKLLYLLSYADLSALSASVWTEWKDILLMELFKAAQNYLLGVNRELAIDATVLQKMSWQIQQHLASPLDQKKIFQHLHDMPVHYLDSFDERQIADHLQLIEQLADQQSQLKFYDNSSHIAITAVTHDRPFCLTDLCGVLAVNDLNIFSAQIFTRQDKVVLDFFRVIPISSHLRFDDIRQQDIVKDLNGVLSGSLDLPDLFLQHQRKWKRRKYRKTDNPDEIHFENRISDRFTIIDIFTDDSPGLLYRLALAMAELGLNIQSAKISTRIDQVADSFYVVDADGNKITPEKQAKIHQHLIKAIRREF